LTSNEVVLSSRCVSRGACSRADRFRLPRLECTRCLRRMTIERDPTPDGDAAERQSRQIRTALIRARLRVASFPLRVRAVLRAHLPSEAQHLFGLTIVVGIVCGFTAVAFHLAIRAAEGLLIERALSAPGSSWMVWTIVTPTLGGLLAGALLTWVVPGARGSGIPQVKVAYATEGGRVRFRDAFGKFVVGALQIGSGASLGREGPTVQICAGATSLLARATNLPPRNMRRLTPVGVAAGIAAAFNAPIAAVTFTIEEIIGSLDNTVLSGVVVAAALAAVIERGVLGVHPVIEVKQNYGLEHASSLFTYALLGIAGAVVSVAFSDGLLRLRAWFRRFTLIPAWAHPAVGGFVTGALAVVVMATLEVTGISGGAYSTLGRALDGELGFRALVTLCVIKLIATIFSYSSGGAGGIFAPALFVGAMLGGTFGYCDQFVFSRDQVQLGPFALVGMGAVFAGVIRAPITSVLIIFEMTGGYGLVLPLMVANMTSYALARRWRPEPIYDALLAQDGIELPHASPRAHVLERLTVADAMTTPAQCVLADQTVADAASVLEGRAFTIAPVVKRGEAVGGVLLAELRRAASNTPEMSVRDLLLPMQIIRADAPLMAAVVRMTDLGVRQLLVVDTTDVSKLLGIVAMSDLVRAHAHAAPASVMPHTNSSSASVSGPELRAETLMLSCVVVPAETKLSQLAERLHDTQSFVVRSADRFSVLPLQSVDGLLRDEDLEGVLIAGDVARAAPTVSLRANLQELLRALYDARSEAAVVCGESGREPLGIVTRSAVSDALFEWFTVRANAARATRRVSRPSATECQSAAPSRSV